MNLKIAFFIRTDTKTIFGEKLGSLFRPDRDVNDDANCHKLVESLESRVESRESRGIFPLQELRRRTFDYKLPALDSRLRTLDSRKGDSTINISFFDAKHLRFVAK